MGIWSRFCRDVYSVDGKAFSPLEKEQSLNSAPLIQIFYNRGDVPRGTSPFFVFSVPCGTIFVLVFFLFHVIIFYM